ncbi:MAG TPA: bifunctional phosphoserine phosphatase/homoserine phosphotransferase ThrH [Spirochaetota bacterium]|nr:bifunctional phosphoserine phosphatase/homoserine phosphotransferase ThrH [Spirochaetota bacterium]
MILACLDLEGVLLPEIWINVAEKTGIKELRLTTRDISDYDKLMTYRLGILRENNIKLKDIEDVINTLEPLEGAKFFLYKLKEKFQVIILSDTFYQFAMPLMKKLDFPALFCHNLVTDKDGFISNYILRIKDSKRNSIIKFRELNFKTVASGDSYNDISMLKEADKGILFSPPENVVKEFPQFPVTYDYDSLWDEFLKAEEQILRQNL